MEQLKTSSLFNYGVIAVVSFWMLLLYPFNLLYVHLLTKAYLRNDNENLVMNLIEETELFYRSVCRYTIRYYQKMMAFFPSQQQNSFESVSSTTLPHSTPPSDSDSASVPESTASNPATHSPSELNPASQPLSEISESSENDAPPPPVQIPPNISMTDTSEKLEETESHKSSAVDAPSPELPPVPDAPKPESESPQKA